MASGMAGDDRFPKGTLALQVPKFAEEGLDLKPYYRGTINVSIAPLTFRAIKAWKLLPMIEWSPEMPAENFSFYKCGIRSIAKESFVEGLVYWPHPSTKPEFFQDPSILEILAPFIRGITYGSPVELKFDSREIEIMSSP